MGDAGNVRCFPETKVTSESRSSIPNDSALMIAATVFSLHNYCKQEKHLVQQFVMCLLDLQAAKLFAALAQ